LALSISQMYGADQAMRGYAFVESMSAIGYLTGPFIGRFSESIVSLRKY
jgi:hypothetical protein